MQQVRLPMEKTFAWADSAFPPKEWNMPGKIEKWDYCFSEMVFRTENADKTCDQTAKSDCKVYKFAASYIILCCICS